MSTTVLTPPSPALLTVDDAAGYLRKSSSWVYKAARAGLLPALRVGWEIRFELEALQAYARGEWKPKRARVLPLRGGGAPEGA